MKILICGGGAVGSHVLLLGRNLPHKFAVVDDDRVEMKNLSSQWFIRQMVGKQKAAALKLQMQNLYGVGIEEFSVRLAEANAPTLLSQCDVAVDCLDNGASRRLLQRTCRNLMRPCLHAGLAADGSFGLVRWDSVFVPDDEDVPGQATCEHGNFLPLIARVSSAVVSSLEIFSKSGVELQWNVSPAGSESF